MSTRAALGLNYMNRFNQKCTSSEFTAHIKAGKMVPMMRLQFSVLAVLRKEETA